MFNLILILIISSTAFAAPQRRTMKESLQYVLESKEFVELTPTMGLKIDLRYATANNFTGRNLYGEFNRAFLHKDAAQRFVKAIAHLKQKNPGYQLLIFDALRPRSAQYVLWDHVKGTEQEIYVANPERGSIHNYGFAVDLSVVDASGKELDMGTAFDTFSPLSQPRREVDFLKSGEITKTQVQNRLILKEAMAAAGFAQLSREWWHFDALTRAEVEAKYTLVE